MISPVKSPVITSPYGWRSLHGQRQFHDGIDVISAIGDKSVYAICPGIVVHDVDYYDESKRWTDGRHSAGNMVIILHEVGELKFYLRYLHLVENYVSLRGIVEEGDPIGMYGDVGYSFGAHLHVDLYTFPQWEKIDPTPIIGQLLI